MTVEKIELELRKRQAALVTLTVPRAAPPNNHPHTNKITFCISMRTLYIQVAFKAFRYNFFPFIMSLDCERRIVNARLGDISVRHFLLHLLVETKTHSDERVSPFEGESRVRPDALHLRRIFFKGPE